MKSSNFSALSDEQLLLLLKQSNEFAFDEIFRRYWHGLFRTASSILRDNEIARDMVQEIFTQCWLKRKELEIKKLSAYLYQATKLKCFEQLRKDKICQEVINRFDNLTFANDTEERIHLNELKECFEKSLNEMPEKSLQVFKLSRIENLTNQEIAAQLNISVKTVEYHMTNALKHLKLSLTDYFIIILILFF